MQQSVEHIALFRDVPDLDFAALSRRCHWRRCEEGETIIDFEDESTDVYFILSGAVRILIRAMSGREIILADMGADDLFGEMSAIDGVSRSANVTALRRTELCIMRAALLRDLIYASPSVCDRVLRLFTARIRAMNTRLTEHSMLDLRHRLYAELLRMARPRAGAEGEAIISPPPFHHDLSARIGCRREQVSRELSLMAKSGLVERTKGALVLRQPETLQQKVDAAMAAGH